MEPRYDPSGVEERWQETWESEGLYNADPDPARTPYVDAHPPPNVTGELHMGHALQLAVGDTVVRHEADAGLQHALPARLRPRRHLDAERGREAARCCEGTSRQELGRERVRGARLGVAARVRRQDPRPVPADGRVARLPARRASRWTTAYVRAVMRFFVHLYGRGWIYRANRIINWCPYHLTSLSDLELEHVDIDDTLTTIRYPLADGDGYIAIATVRPATIPADVAVAVHPDDERYRDLVGREVIVPWVERRVPVIADERVEMRLRHRRAQDHAGPRSRPTSRSAATTASPSRCASAPTAASRAEPASRG